MEPAKRVKMSFSRLSRTISIFVLAWLLSKWCAYGFSHQAAPWSVTTEYLHHRLGVKWKCQVDLWLNNSSFCVLFSWLKVCSSFQGTQPEEAHLPRYLCLWSFQAWFYMGKSQGACLLNALSMEILNAWNTGNDGGSITLGVHTNNSVDMNETIQTVKDMKNYSWTIFVFNIRSYWYLQVLVGIRCTKCKSYIRKGMPIS